MIKTLFPTQIPVRADAVNAAGGSAYASSPQYAVTSCLGSTFYTSERDQLDKIVAGWGDQVFNMIADFVRGEKTNFVKTVEAIQL